jgi:hypothetical protein
VYVWGGCGDVYGVFVCAMCTRVCGMGVVCGAGVTSHTKEDTGILKQRQMG